VEAAPAPSRMLEAMRESVVETVSRKVDNIEKEVYKKKSLFFE
jgi:hypothetical protein